MSGGSVNPNLISYIFRGVLFLKKLCIDEERGRDLATNGAWYLVPGIVTLSIGTVPSRIAGGLTNEGRLHSFGILAHYCCWIIFI